MKYLIIILVTVACFGCSKKNDTSVNINPAAVGKWVVVKDSIAIYNNGDSVRADKNGVRAGYLPRITVIISLTPMVPAVMEGEQLFSIPACR